VSKNQKAAFLLLVAVLWAIAPLFVCLRSASAQNLPACCQSMPPDCPMQGANAEVSCCRMNAQSGAVVPDSPAPVEIGTGAALLPQIASVHSLLALSTVGASAFENSPPASSPPRSTIIRI
jgi:hypothetical protein